MLSLMHRVNCLIHAGFTLFVAVAVLFISPHWTGGLLAVLALVCGFSREPRRGRYFGPITRIQTSSR